ncbi:peptidase M48 Ste24p [Methanolacinia petrolearia DSM 11571]|uniref:Protease HtpX homolog n=1 Tax=Methanolacinia petrolearia (strain DSM 11571 / OCM 486 / SEBR 4847) TaxID=679926 RepID=E1RE06_METP4|nr:MULTISPECIES: zinc metalloprotease HtpX [Methanolacinia]ADN34897.1 peptidase M48 Ste24p [Methanolacinia petrolearia DSM 11571]
MIGKWKRDWGLSGRVFMTWIFILALYVVFINILYFLFPGYLYMIIAFVFLMAFVQYFFSAKLVLMTTHARIVSEDEEPELHRMIEKLCQEADLPKPKIAVMPSPVPNAFATGRNPKNAVVAVTDSIMRTLNREELEAVIAHELSHVKNRDILTMTVAGFLASLASIIMQNALIMNLFDGRNNNGAWIVIWIVSIIVWIVATLLMLLLSRYREFAADRGSAMITGNPAALRSALMKISGRMDAIPAKKKQEIEGSNAFFIIPAISGKSLTELLSTHPPLEKRLAALEKIERELKGY